MHIDITTMEVVNTGLLSGEFDTTNFTSSHRSGGEAHNPEPLNMPGRVHEKELISKEREEELDAWMIQVKNFIRNIDISSL